MKNKKIFQFVIPHSSFVINNKGIAMAITILIMLMVTMLISAIMVFRLTETRKDKINFDKVKAGYIAEAGIENLAWYLRAYQSTNWEWGDPNYTGVITTCQSGTYCFGTKINGNYRNNLYYQEMLVSPKVTVSTTNPLLCFYYQIWTGGVTDTADTGYVYWTKNNGINWTQLATTYGGNAADITAWTSASPTLTGVNAGDKINVGFLLYSDSNLNYAGWYIDNVGIDTACPVADPYDFYDDFENGPGDWSIMIRANAGSEAPNACSLSPCQFPVIDDKNEYFDPHLYFVTIDPRFSSSDTLYVRSKGILGDYTGVAEAKITVHGGSPPYKIKIQDWKKSY